MNLKADVSLGAVRERERERESYTLVNKSSLLSLAKAVALCLLENINMNKKTEIKPIKWFLIAVFFCRLIKLLNF